MDNIIIRKGTLKDANIIAEFNHKMAWETESKTLKLETLQQGVIQGLTQPNLCQYYVAEKASSVLGQAMVTFEWSDWRNGQLWWLQSVYVHPDYRNQGVFKKIFSHIESLARANSRVVGLRLYVEEENQIGKLVYKNLGMVNAGYHVYETEF